MKMGPWVSKTLTAPIYYSESLKIKIPVRFFVSMKVTQKI
jgi:hypothetical protein